MHKLLFKDSYECIDSNRHITDCSMIVMDILLHLLQDSYEYIFDCCKRYQYYPVAVIFITILQSLAIQATLVVLSVLLRSAR